MFDAIREIEVGEYLPEDIQEALCISLHPIDKATASENGDCSPALISALLNGTRKVTEKSQPVVMELLVRSKHNSSNMAANGHRIYNIMDQFELPDIDAQVKKLARDGKY